MQEGKGTLIALSDSVASVLLPLNTVKSAYIQYVSHEGKAISIMSAESVSLEPGMYDVGLRCTLVHNGVQIRGESRHQVWVEAGKRYVFRTFAVGQRQCEIRIEQG